MFLAWGLGASPHPPSYPSTPTWLPLLSTSSSPAEGSLSTVDTQLLSFNAYVSFKNENKPFLSLQSRNSGDVSILWQGA